MLFRMRGLWFLTAIKYDELSSSTCEIDSPQVAYLILIALAFSVRDLRRLN